MSVLCVIFDVWNRWQVNLILVNFCGSNFITFRMFHPNDLNIISNISSNVSMETINKLKNLTPGTAMIFGVSFKLPLIAKLELPDPMPQSTSVDIKNRWYE